VQWAINRLATRLLQTTWLIESLNIANVWQSIAASP